MSGSFRVYDPQLLWREPWWPERCGRPVPKRRRNKGYAGTYKAILSDATTSAASRLTITYAIVNA